MQLREAADTATGEWRRPALPHRRAADTERHAHHLLAALLEHRGGESVAGVLRQWERAYPGLDTGPIAVLGRINRCAALLQQTPDPLTRCWTRSTTGTASASRSGTRTGQPRRSSYGVRAGPGRRGRVRSSSPGWPRSPSS